MAGGSRPGGPEGDDIDDADEVEVRRIQPYQARKVYLCPGCNQSIDVGLGHLVVVPKPAPDLRRHWHHACWANRQHRRPG